MIDEAVSLVYAKGVGLMFSGRSVSDGMGQLAASMDAVAPGRVCESVQALGRISRHADLANWLADQLAIYPTGVDVLWFALSDAGGDISLCLLREKTPPRDDRDWDAYDHVTDVDVPSEILRPLHELMEATSMDTGATASVRWMVETSVPLTWAGLMVCAAVRQLPTPTLLGLDSRRRVAVFFGEGDDFFLGEIDAGGFRYVDPPAPSAA